MKYVLTVNVDIDCNAQVVSSEATLTPAESSVPTPSGPVEAPNATPSDGAAPIAQSDGMLPPEDGTPADTGTTGPIR